MNVNRVKFKVLEIEDARKSGCELYVGGIFEGELSENRGYVYFIDKADCEWIFYVGLTCELV